MKVLFVSAVPTHPTHEGNRVRVRTLVEAVAGLGHETHFAWVTMARATTPVAMAEHFGDRLHVLWCRPRRSAARLGEHLRRRLQQRLGLEAGYRWSLDAWYDAQLTPMLRRLQAAHRFDAVCIEYVYLSGALAAFDPSVRKIIDTHDRFTDRHRLAAGTGTRYEWFSLSAADERRGLARADTVIAIQGQEAQAFRAQLPSTVHVETVGHVFDPPAAVERARNQVALLVGADNPMNVEAARYFVDAVLPRVRRREPAFGLLIAGDVGAHVADQCGVRKLGRVGDMASAYRQAAVAVNPVQRGTGFCIKSLEAMALGVPLVTTVSGARGLERYSGRAMITIGNDDTDAMAEAVTGLLHDPARADAMGRAARAAALEFNASQLAALRRVLAHACWRRV